MLEWGSCMHAKFRLNSSKDLFPMRKQTLEQGPIKVLGTTLFEMLTIQLLTALSNSITFASMDISLLFQQRRPQWQGEMVYEEAAHTEKTFPKG